MDASTRTPTNWGNLAELGPRHVSTLPRYWFTRIYVALATLASIVATVLEPTALTHRLIEKSGAQGWGTVAVLAGICLVAVADVVVNDLLSARYSIPWAKTNRHFVYIALSIGIFCLSYVFAVGEGEHNVFRPLLLPFWLDGTAAAAVAFLDLFQRHRAPQ